MKKLVSIVAIAAMTFTLAGCKDGNATVSDGNKALVSVGKEKVTKEDVFQTAKKAYGASYTLNDALNIIVKKENIKMTSDMKKQAEAQLSAMKSSAGKDFEKQLKSNGYKNEQDYMKKEVYPNILQQGLVKKYVKAKQDSMFKTYAPYKLAIIQTDTKDKAQAAIKAVQNGTSMKDAAAANGNTEMYKGLDDVYTNKSGLPEALYDKVKAQKKPGLIASVIADDTNKKYYVVNVVDTNPKDFANAAIDKIVTTGSTDLSTASSVYYLNKYHFKTYDKTIYDGLKALNPKYVKN